MSGGGATAQLPSPQSAQSGMCDGWSGTPSPRSLDAAMPHIGSDFAGRRAAHAGHEQGMNCDRADRDGNRNFPDQRLRSAEDLPPELPLPRPVLDTVRSGASTAPHCRRRPPAVFTATGTHGFVLDAADRERGADAADMRHLGQFVDDEGLERAQIRRDAFEEEVDLAGEDVALAHDLPRPAPSPGRRRGRPRPGW